MNKSEKLAELQAGPGAAGLQASHAVSLSSPFAFTGSVKAPTLALAGALPPDGHLPSPISMATPSSGPSSSSSHNGPAPSRPNAPASGLTHPIPPPTHSPGGFSAPSLVPAMDLVPPLTSTASDPKTLNSATSYSLAGPVGVVSRGKTKPFSEQTQLNGSILDHLSPASSMHTHHAPKLAPTGLSSFATSDGLPHYDVARPSRSVPASTTMAPPTSVGDYAAGATQGGVLLRHIPYLPAASDSLGVGSGRVGPVEDDPYEHAMSQEVGGDGGRGLTGKGSVDSEEVVELEQKLKVQAQTIDILVSEKSALQIELRSLRTQLSNKNRESQDCELHAKGTRQKMSDLEKKEQDMTSELSRKREELERARLESAELWASLERLRTSLEDQQEESTELISKVTAQSAEILELQSAKTELQSKLNMAELLTQQLSEGKPIQATPTDPALSAKLQEAKGRVSELQRKLELASCEKEQVNSDLSALEDTMQQQHRDSTRKLSECQTQLAEARANVTVMRTEMEEMRREKEVQQITEHAQSEASGQAAHVLESVEQEKEQLKTQLEKQVQENIQLVKTNTELESHVLEVELKLSRLQEQSVDHQNLLTSMAQDKETLSRAMSQNKELKRNMTELQDAIIKWSNQNMELASELETERRRVSYLRAQAAATPTTTPTTPASQTTPTLPITTPTSAPSHIVTATLERGVREEGVVPEGEAEEGSKKQQEINALVLENEHLKEEFEQLRAEYSILHQMQRERAPPHSESPLQQPKQAKQDKPVSVPPSQPGQAKQDELVPPLQPKWTEWDDSVSSDTGPSPQEKQVSPRPKQAKQDDVVSSDAELPSVCGPRQEQVEQVDSGAVSPLERGPRPEGEELLASDALPLLVEDHTHLSGDHAHPLSSRQLAELQSSFNALQRKFVVLMREKADLLDKIQEHEVVILKLSSETETIGDYIALYQTQREALKTKFQEKDNFIQQLMSEKSAMQVNIRQLQVLVKKVLWEQRHSPMAQRSRLVSSLLSPSLPSTSTPSTSHISTPSYRPPQQPSANIPIHLRPQLYSETSVEEGEEEEGVGTHTMGAEVDTSSYLETELEGGASHMTEEESPVTTATAEQIMELLDQLEVNSHLDGSGEVVVHCRHCTGKLLVA